MQIKIKRLTKDVLLPQYQTPGSVAFDLSAAADAEILPGEVKLIPTGLIITTPPDCMLMLASRSSLALKKGLMMANGIGIVDQDYCGSNDEIKIQVLNIKKEPVKVEKGERIAQAVFVRIEKPQVEEINETMSAESRGGHGSTGGYK